MSIFRRQLTNTSTGTIDNWKDFAEFLGIPNNGLNVNGKKALKESTVYTCIKILAETVGKTPVKIYQDNNGVLKAAEHYLNPLLKLRPNPYMSAIDLKKCTEVQRNIYGNAFVWNETASSGSMMGRVIARWPLDSERMQIWVDDRGLINSSCSVWYVYKDKLNKEHKINESEISHYKGLSVDGIVGMSAIETLKSTIENAKSSSDFLNNSYKSGMQTAGIINYTGDLNAAAEKKFREKFEQMSAGLKNANRISMLPIGYQYQPMALKLTDAQFLENTRFTLQQLTAAFGIKPHQINDQTKTSYASTSEANREFYTDTMLAIYTMYEQEDSYKLFNDFELEKGLYLKYNVDIILRADLKSRYETYAQGIQNGFLKPDEARALEERENAPGGDELYINSTMKKLTDVGKESTGG